MEAMSRFLALYKALHSILNRTGYSASVQSRDVKILRNYRWR